MACCLMADHHLHAAEPAAIRSSDSQQEKGMDGVLTEIE